ncbi:cobyrinate a,c-diamide synthase [Alkalilimnicola ehrlichii]|uniref:cobyrinate a,c-diamide synthase n=1 Tax=Alkalilimnicola ehrlichii TaxID=351052 RepID=UPI003B9F9449
MLVTAPASGQGKTTVCAALARYHRNQGRTVRVFKTGPDFLDPLMLTRASGAPVRQIDLWMVGRQESRRQLYQAAAEADLILIEGSMGLYDGVPSSADLAEAFGVPVCLLIDASAMAQTFGAVAYGLAEYRADVTVAGVLANRVAGEGHTRLLRESLPAGMTWFGALPRSPAAQFPDRHLGLCQPEEVDDLDGRLDEVAAAMGKTGAGALPPPVAFRPEPEVPTPGLLAGRRIGIARDEAFSFIYPANVDGLRALGAEVTWFSPLHDEALPAVDAVWLPGGYPELHLEALSRNHAMHRALAVHVAAERPLLAECGGFLYLLEELVDGEGHAAPMAGLLPGRAWMRPRLTALGLQRADYPSGGLRGHTFHHSQAEVALTPWFHCERLRGGKGEAVYRRGSVVAGYQHHYFPSSPEATAELLGGPVQ